MFIMPESIDISPEVLKLSETVSVALSNWLQEEVASSVVGKNQVLDDYTGFYNSLLKPSTDPNNVNYGKALSHFNRLRLWTDQFANMVDSDQATARQLFCVQMFMSGLFRTQCMLEATDQEDYYQRRMSGKAVGVDLSTVIAEQMQTRSGTLKDHVDFSSATPNLAELVELTDQTNETHKALIQKLHDRDNSTSNVDLPMIEDIKTMQVAWAELAVDYILFAAHERGDQLAPVPFWEPKSISENPAIYYPFQVA